VTFSVGSRSRLTPHDIPRFPSDSLFDRIARAVCAAGCLPRRELYEAWEVARRTRRLFRGGRIVDMAGGHGLLAHVMLLLDDSSPEAIVVDRHVPESSNRVQAALVRAWPRIDGRVQYVEADLGAFGVLAGDVVVSAHACGALTDAVLRRAVDARARVAVLPCCHDARASDAGPLGGWMDAAMAIDAMRAVRLRACGYRVWTQTIPAAITSKNRLLAGEPERPASKE
jgi:hypothetical protein